MKNLFTIILLVVMYVFGTTQCTGQASKKENNAAETAALSTTADTLESDETTFHSFKVKDINGNDFDLASLKGKKVLVVNVASKCGLTPQYEELQALYETYKNRNFEIVAFPANDFREQEPGTSLEIKEFCTANYGVTFLLMDKVSVVAGENQAPLYAWLTQKSQNGVLDQEITWNFQKYMIDENGRLVDVVMPRESPLSEKIVQWITAD